MDRDLYGIAIQQTQYMKEIIKKFLPADDTLTYSAPAGPALHLVQSQCATSAADRQFMHDVPFREAVGSLLRLALGTLLKFNANPCPVHWNAV